MFFSPFGEKRIRSRQVVRVYFFGPFHFDFHRAGIWRHLVTRVEHEVAASDVRFGQISRIGNDGDPGEYVFIPDEVLDNGSFFASSKTIATNIGRLHMCGRDCQSVALPNSSREALPCMGGILGWMGPAVHPNRTRRRHPGHLRVPGSHFVRPWVNILPDAQIREAWTVIRWMWNTLMFWHSPDRG